MTCCGKVVREPIFPGTELDLLKQGDRADLEQGLTDPQQLASRAVRRALNPYPIGDTRYSPTGEEEIRFTDEVDVTAVKKLYTDFLGAQAGQIVVVGDFDEDETMQALKGMLKGWKAKQPFERITRTGMDMSIVKKSRSDQDPDAGQSECLLFRWRCDAYAR